MLEHHTTEMERLAPQTARLYVCSLAAMPETVRTSGARHLITIINGPMIPPTPAGIRDADHLRIACNDICEPRDGLVCPDEAHVGALIQFGRDWAHRGPLVIHCWAGISRSTAAAFVTLCALNPDACEAEIAARIRRVSPTATPNRRLVALADDALSRRGRMVSAVERIGPGELRMEALPFVLDSRML